MNTYQNTSRKKKRKATQQDTSSGWLSLLLYYVLPFLIVNAILFICLTATPKCTLTLGETHNYLNAEVKLVVNSWFPAKTITLSMDSEPIQLEKGKGRTYKATITKNGTLEASITNINGMSITRFEHVNILDDNPPVIEHSFEDGVVTLTFTDSQSGINLDSIYAVDAEEELLTPLSFDRTTATVSYIVVQDGIRVYAQDLAENQVQGTFTSHKEGEEEFYEGTVSSSEDEDMEDDDIADDAITE